MNRWQTRDDLLNLIAKNEIRLDQWRIFKDTRSQSNKRIELNLHSFRPSNVIELRYNYVTFIWVTCRNGRWFYWLDASVVSNRLSTVTINSAWGVLISFNFRVSASLTSSGPSAKLQLWLRWSHLILLQSCRIGFKIQLSTEIELQSEEAFKTLRFRAMNLDQTNEFEKKKRKIKEKKIDSNVIT